MVRERAEREPLKMEESSLKQRRVPSSGSRAQREAQTRQENFSRVKVVCAPLGRIGATVAIHQQESSELPSMVDDPLSCVVAGLVSDLPCIAGALRQAGAGSPVMGEPMAEAAERLEGEAMRLSPLLSALA